MSTPLPAMSCGFRRFGGNVRTPFPSSAPRLASPFVTSDSLLLSRRTYYWEYNEDFVPKGAKTSRFQSSSVPSIRQQIHKAFALGPLFGERRPVCTLGFYLEAHSSKPVLQHTGLFSERRACSTSSSSHVGTSRPLSPNSDRRLLNDASASPPLTIRRMMQQKHALRECLAAFFDTPAENIVLGSVRQMKEMMLFRGGLAESPRLADQCGAVPLSSSSPRVPIASSASPQHHAMCLHSDRGPGRQPIVATGLLDVEFASTDLTPEESLGYGSLLQRYLHHTPPFVTPAVLPLESSAEEELEQVENGEEDMAEMKRCTQLAAELREKFCVTYCEVPLHPDASDFAFTELYGNPVTEEDLVETHRLWKKSMALLSEASQV